MSNSSRNVGAIEGFASDFDEMEIVFVELHQASNKSFIETKSRETTPKVLMGERRKGRREVEEQAGSEQGIRDGKEMHEGVKKNDIVNEIPAINAFLGDMNFAINNCTKTDLKRRANDLDKGVRERERSQVFRTVRSETTRSKAKGLFGKEYHEGEEQSLLDLLLGLEDETN